MLRWLIILLLGAGTSATGAPPDVPRQVGAGLAPGRAPGHAVGFIEPEGEVRMHIGGVRRQGSRPARRGDPLRDRIRRQGPHHPALARLADEGRVALSDPVDGLLPATVGMAVRARRRSPSSTWPPTPPAWPGCPRTQPADPANPYADYTANAGQTPRRGRPGSAPGAGVYSNLGLGLWGTRSPFARAPPTNRCWSRRSAVRWGWTGPHPGAGSRPHHRLRPPGVRPVAGWDIPVLAGAGDVDSPCPT